MSVQSTSSLKTYVYTSSEGHVDELCGNQVCARLAQLGVEPDRIIRVPDYTYLQRNLLRERACLWLPGAETYYLGNDLDRISALLKQQIAAGQLNIFGSCAGGNLLCQSATFQHPQMGATDATDFFKVWNLLPVKMHTPQYTDQQKYKNKAPGKLIPISLPGGEKGFVSYWNNGSRFDFSSSDITVEARYEDSSIAGFSGNYGKGKIVGLGFHPEIDIDSIIARYSSVELTTNPDLTALTEKKQSAEDSSEARLSFLSHLLNKVEVL